MLYLYCPTCERYCDETELVCGGEAHKIRKDANNNDEEFYDYLYARKNFKGVMFERWRHLFGCGKWFHAARCTATLEVFGTYSAQTFEPPKEIIDIIKSKRPDWKWRNLS